MSLQKILEGAQNLEEITETSRLLFFFEICIKFMTLDTNKQAHKIQIYISPTAG